MPKRCGRACARSLATLQHALAPERFDPRTDAVNYRVAMADATAALLAPWLVRAIEAVQAAANLRVLPLTTRDPRALLEQGTADLAVGPLSRPDRHAADAGETRYATNACTTRVMSA